MIKFDENKPRRIRQLFKNLSFLSKNNLRQEIKQIDKINILQDIILYHSLSNDSEYIEEIGYLKSISDLDIFPYKQLRKLEKIEAGYDSKHQLNFVIHDNKKLYFPKKYSLSTSVETYRNFIESECILGGDYRKKCPHQYQTASFPVKPTDTVIDIGCAEALFSLDIVEKVKNLILIESDDIWKKPLEATFHQYSEKVKIINKLVCSEDSATTTTLSSILDEIEYNGLFIKMDIEGAEVEVMKSITDTLCSGKDIRISCCTYHNENDASDIEKIINDLNTSHNLNLKYHFSDGYMLPYPISHLFPPYFRKSIIRIEV